MRASSRPLPASGRQAAKAGQQEDLPPGWVRVESRSKPGAFYYAHKASGRTQVERPVKVVSGTRALASALDAVSVAPKPSRTSAASTAPIVASVANRPPERPQPEKVVQTVLLEDEESPEEKRRQVESRKVEEEARRSRAEDQRRKAEQQARKQAAEAEAEEAAQEEMRRKAREKRLLEKAAGMKAVEEAAESKSKEEEEEEDVDDAKPSLPKSQAAEEPKRGIMRKVAVRTGKVETAQEKKKAWLEENDSGSDDNVVTREDVRKWMEDEERREREEVERKQREKEAEERRVIEMERELVEEALEAARIEAEKEENLRKQIEDEERRKLEEEQRRLDEVARVKAEYEEKLRAQQEEERNRLEEERKRQEDERNRQEEEHRKQQEALVKARKEAELQEAVRQKQEEKERRKQEEAQEIARKEANRKKWEEVVRSARTSADSESDAKRQRTSTEQDWNTKFGQESWSSQNMAHATRATGTIIWYNGRQQRGALLADIDQKILQIPPQGAPNGSLTPPVPAGLMHGTRVNYVLGYNENLPHPICSDVRPKDGQFGLSCGGDSQRGLRPENEDRTVAVDLPDGLGHMVGIFDGHRGTTCADFLAQSLPKAVASSVKQAFKETLASGRTVESITNAEEVDMINSGLVAAFEAADREYLSAAQCYNWGDGATAVVAMVAHGFQTADAARSTVPIAPGGQAKCFVAWCGLGRMLLLRGKQGIRCTKDHVCSQEDEQQRLRAVGALLVTDPHGVMWMSRPDRLGQFRQRQQGYEEATGPKQFLSSSRGFGDTLMKQLPSPVLTASPEVAVVDLGPTDWALVLAGRGVFSALTDQEVAEICLETAATMGKGPREAAQAVTTRALMRGAQDNVTCIVMRLGWAQPPTQQTLAQLLGST